MSAEAKGANTLRRAAIAFMENATGPAQSRVARSGAKNLS
jgi:hypothetical protein